jgi:hypothetical protein
MFSVRVKFIATGVIVHLDPRPLDMAAEAANEMRLVGLDAIVVPVMPGYTFGCDPYNTADCLY